jgi:hypothetical protein
LEFAVVVEFVNEVGGDLHLAAVEAEFATHHHIPMAFQARHKLDFPNQEVASRNLIPVRGGEEGVNKCAFGVGSAIPLLLAAWG